MKIGLSMDEGLHQGTAFWDSFVRAVGATPHKVRDIQGASGIQHPVVAAGIDSGQRRLVIISFEPDARSAALMQADIQSVLRSIQIIVARPVTLSLHHFSRFISANKKGTGDVGTGSQDDDSRADPIYDVTGETVDDLLDTFVSWMQQQTSLSMMPPDLIDEWKHRLFSQLSSLLLKSRNNSLENRAQRESIRLRELAEGDNHEESLLDDLMAVDPMEQDRKLGLCAVPLDDFSPDNLDLFQSGTDLEAIQQVLRQRDILQYFYPPPDQLALGLVERGEFASIPQLVDQLVRVPDSGHPFGPSELIPPQGSFTEMIEMLRDHKLIAQGDHRLEITEEGASIRSHLRERPREGLLSKILNRTSATLSFKSSWLQVIRFQRE